MAALLSRFICVLAMAIAMTIGAGGVAAQQGVDPSAFEVPAAPAQPSILTVDIERLFAQSRFGERVSQTYTEARVALNDENRRIADALRAEELNLARQRADMDPDVFRAEAEAFDEKAQGIRRAQDAKEAALDESLAQGRTQFLDVTRPILGQLMIERGAFAILDRRSVLLSLGTIDVTDDAIARIDETLGDGSAVDLQSSDPDEEQADDGEPADTDN